MCKFYRYLSYRIYTRLQYKKDPCPVMTTALLFYILHLVQFTGLTCIFPFLLLPVMDVTTQYICVIAFFTLHVLIWNRKRVEKCVEEFKDELAEKKRKRTILILTYCFGSFIITTILFFNT